MAGIRITTASEYLTENPRKGVALDVPVSRHHYRPATRIYTFHDFFLVSHSGIPLSDTGDILADRFIYPQLIQGDLDILLSPGFTEHCGVDCITKKGKYMPLYGDWSTGFWHWMMEKLPLAMLAETARYDGYYVIPRGCPFAARSLALLGVAPERIIEHDGTNWLVEILCLPLRVDLSDQEVFVMLRRILLEKTKHLADRHSSRRVYISRKSAQSKRIANEEQLITTIAPYRFETQLMEDLPLDEQIAMMSTADALITPHGAGMVHTLFMPPQSLVMELFAPTYINPCMLPTVDLLRHRYYMVPSYLNYPDQYLSRDIEAFLSVIAITLKRELHDDRSSG